MKLNQITALLNNIAPLELAADWDNVGLLLEPKPDASIKRVLLSVDLTQSVIEEAIKKKVNLILCYHPILFKPVQSLCMSSPFDRNLLLLIQKKIALYSPHTALDHVIGGVNDWLIDGCGVGEVTFINPSKDQLSGAGRMLSLNRAVSINTLCKRIKSHLHTPYLRVAPGASNNIRTIACCAGAGASVLTDVQADCYLTGEMSHHDVLAAQATGSTVILSEHTHTERGFLPLYQSIIQKALNAPVELIISTQDKDPLHLK
ncbi:MAG TPA: Nif3-like dinuclear metal center hexameric protein [Verrucomicrobia bacterium]|nr:Nif3-like dinuclear metal center hexameric protein [Verrucomicrobiota bacterium]|tara:strand:+ start:67 stop:846 length:780 start_codon:yes stop_codon:yes gene_type:complete